MLEPEDGDYSTYLSTLPIDITDQDSTTLVTGETLPIDTTNQDSTTLITRATFPIVTTNQDHTTNKKQPRHALPNDGTIPISCRYTNREELDKCACLLTYNSEKCGMCPLDCVGKQLINLLADL